MPVIIESEGGPAGGRGAPFLYKAGECAQ